MTQGAFTRLILADLDKPKSEHNAPRIHNRLISFLVYVEKRKGKLQRKAFTLADAAEEMEEDDISNNPTE